MFKRSHPQANISIQQGTEFVPDDGAYYLLDGTTVVSRHPTLKKATQAYNAELLKRGIDLSAPPPPASTPADTPAAPPSSTEFYVFGKSRRKRTGTRTFG